MDVYILWNLLPALKVYIKQNIPQNLFSTFIKLLIEEISQLIGKNNDYN